MQSLNKCRTNCTHKECQRHASLGVVDKNEMECGNDQSSSSTNFLENVIDLSHTLAQIMILCGIHECKAKTAVDIITYSFLHYDLVCYCLNSKPTKRLRKEDIFHELGRKCLMNRVEAHLSYNIIKRGFKAFYYKPNGDEDLEKHENKTTIAEECVYVHAAKKTTEAYARFEGLSCDEIRAIEPKIQMIYKKFYDRMELRKAKTSQQNCNCCFCAKSRGHLIYGPPPPCTEKPRKKSHTCPHCCKRKKSRKLIHGSTVSQKCPVCHRALNLCICSKYQFDLNWIDSIWTRPDMNDYYVENIEKEHEEQIIGCVPQEHSTEDENKNVEEQTEF